jgi:hypothetical protein
MRSLLSSNLVGLVVWLPLLLLLIVHECARAVRPAPWADRFVRRTTWLVWTLGVIFIATVFARFALFSRA